MSTDITARGLALGAKQALAKLQRQIVGCTRANFATYGSAGSAAMARMMFYCPQGATEIQLMFAGFYAGAAEVDFTAPIPFTASVSADEPAPWDATRTYAVGDKVSFYATTGGGGSYANNPLFTCAAPNTNSPPKPGNANWTAGSRPIAVPVTFNGTRDGTIPMLTLPSGASAIQTYRLSDTIPVRVPVGGFLTVYTWVNNSNGLYPAGLTMQGMALGGLQTRGAAQADYTMTQNLFGANSSVALPFQPIAILGKPLVPVPGVAVFADSVGSGTSGSAGIGGYAIANGGSGWAVGDLFTLDTSALTAGAMASGSGFVGLVEAVSGGAITAVNPVYLGGFSGTASQTGQTQPSGATSLVALSGSGTGASLTITSMGSGSLDEGDMRGCCGPFARGLGAAGLPHVIFGSPGDRANLYMAAGGAQRRFAVAGQLGARNAIIELGNNDYVSGDSAATIIANLTGMASRLRGLGFEKVFLCTITPGSTSTSAAGASTTVSQSAGGFDAVRQAVNLWVRGGAISAGVSDGCIDIAAPIEEGGATAPTGKWLPINGKSAAADGKHPGKDAMAIMARAVAVMAGQMVV
ncbi:SGNH/GDSL hydrolase family protein [Novosphingobium terrae]|uniref:SGNH/GDSL hydrolase family protein n=1 Tax=Novosphingobium terrae TaxID=2726189 RepID=UPI00197E59AD|nr:hypothetical protein [Novosphingobium terrae]